ncbi:hypothetical protein [Micromonospora rubida]
MRHREVEVPLTRGERFRLARARHSGRLLGGVAALVVVVFLAGLALIGVRFVKRVGDGAPLLPGLAATPAPRPTDESGNSLGPFVATPAENFAEGEAAITLPAARAAGPFTARQVTDGLTQVRKALVEGRLGAHMLLDDPARFLALLAPDARVAVREDLARGASLGYATRILPDTEPRWDHRDGIRAQGTVEYRSTTDDDGIRVLAVTTRFLWVYSFDLWRPQSYPPGAELVTLKDEVVWHVPHPDDVRRSSRGLWINDTAVTMLNVSCAAIDKGFIDLEDEQPLLRPQPMATGDIFDQGWRAGDGEDC